MLELGIYYVIRHKTTGEIMPQGKKNRGYSHWNPSNKDNPVKFNHGMTEALSIPRLVDTRRRAHGCIAAWCNNPNAVSDYDGDIKLGKLDGRKKEDLEVVEVEIVERKPQ